MNKVKTAAEAVKAEIAKIIVGQNSVIEELMAALFVGGHVLLEGVPGVGKTLLARSLARCVNADFKRIQFTPDLMPSDVVGTNVFNMKENDFSLRKGPIFTDLLLADEINRTPPKTQAALLEAMQEGRVTIDGVGHNLSPIFLVCATQNPVEFEGTYPLPEAQLDRFLLKVRMDYPEAGEEAEILRRFHLTPGSGIDVLKRVQTVTDVEKLLELKKAVNDVRVEEDIFRYITQIVRATRELPQVGLGASPRAAIALLYCAKAAAAMQGLEYITPDHVKRMAHPVLRHRLFLLPEAEVEGRTPEQFIDRILGAVPVPR